MITMQTRQAAPMQGSSGQFHFFTFWVATMSVFVMLMLDPLAEWEEQLIAFSFRMVCTELNVTSLLPLLANQLRLDDITLFSSDTSPCGPTVWVQDLSLCRTDYQLESWYRPTCVSSSFSFKVCLLSSKRTLAVASFTRDSGKQLQEQFQYFLVTYLSQVTSMGPQLIILKFLSTGLLVLVLKHSPLPFLVNILVVLSLGLKKPWSLEDHPLWVLAWGLIPLMRVEDIPRSLAQPLGEMEQDATEISRGDGKQS